MANINAYLTFNGNCREAMNFYKDCLGGELVFQTVGESPMCDSMPEQMKNAIMHSSLTNGALVIMATDMASPKGVVVGDNIALLLNCDSEEHARAAYGKLSEGGEQTHKLEPTFWGALFGDLTDKFGNHWLINYMETNNQ